MEKSCFPVRALPRSEAQRLEPRPLKKIFLWLWEKCFNRDIGHLPEKKSKVDQHFARNQPARMAATKWQSAEMTVSSWHVRMAGHYWESKWDIKSRAKVRGLLYQNFDFLSNRLNRHRSHRGDSMASRGFRDIMHLFPIQTPFERLGV